MEYDVRLATELKAGRGLPTLRTYGWQPFAVSIGYNQQEEDFDSRKLHEAGIDLVRRPTGGRAIFHAEELTYSVVVPAGPRGPRELYRRINEGLLAGLSLLGINAHLTESGDGPRIMYRGPASVACFSSSAASEIQSDGRKLIGSAQRRYGGIILQHGSLLLGPAHRTIAEFLAPHLQESSAHLNRRLIEHTIDAGTILDRTVSFDEAAECIRTGFASVWDVVFAGEATAEEAHV